MVLLHPPSLPPSGSSPKNDETATGRASQSSVFLTVFMNSSRLHKLQEALRSHVPFWTRKKEGYWECIRQLGQGEMEQQDAHRLLEAYKKLWPQAINSFADTILTANAIVLLHRGLCMGALRHLAEVLPDALYRPLIFQFCTMASLLTIDNNEVLQSTVVNAYQAVEGMMNSPFPEAKTTVPLSADTTLYLASSRVKYNDHLIETIDDTIASLHQDCPANAQEAPVSSATLISGLAETLDVQVASKFTQGTSDAI
ncbi:hypothetical protein FPHYL_168 [Fusarium phyllophilum]|uniref:Uncharacterized protein n=1 Tax=Fusarium phyllophilum TaxID=47803 RepID=A0A8H5KCM3_9HYPO|nr:hypothetical protein FPHYL_168 [Fusarium phyllophilum]